MAELAAVDAVLAAAAVAAAVAEAASAVVGACEAIVYAAVVAMDRNDNPRVQRGATLQLAALSERSDGRDMHRAAC